MCVCVCVCVLTHIISFVLGISTDKKNVASGRQAAHLTSSQKF